VCVTRSAEAPHYAQLRTSWIWRAG
jgi:hypothetical protein